MLGLWDVTTEQGTNMDLEKELIKLKKSRLGDPKIPLNITVSKERFSWIESQITAKVPYYELLGPSDRVEFCLYILSKFMENSEIFKDSE